MVYGHNRYVRYLRQLGIRRYFCIDRVLYGYGSKMGWLTSVARFSRIKWVPYVAALWVASVGGTSLWGYMKGKAVVEQRMAVRIADALEVQLEELKRVHDADLVTVVHTLAAEQELTNDINDIEFPEIVPECEHILHDWLRAFNEAAAAVPRDPG